MEKYPILDGRQRKICKNKAELPEVQVLMVPNRMVIVGTLSWTIHHNPF